MADPRNRLRPLLHSGVPFKIKQAIDEILRRDDPALFDWALEAAYVDDLAMSEHWQWKYDDVQELRHPSLDPDEILRLAAAAKTPRAAALRKQLGKLGLELKWARRDDAFLDVSMLGGLTDTTKLRLQPKEIESLYEWRAELAKTPP